MIIPILVFPDGRRVELDDDVVMGRVPVAPESSPARSISLSVRPAPTTQAFTPVPARSFRPVPTSAPTPPQDVFYAPVQSPEPPFSGPGAPPFS